MTDILELREKVAVDVRSLLLSTPIGLTAQQLRDDYYSFVGRTLPYKELGYYGVEDMVKDMPDVVHVTWQAGQMILKAVVNEETKRIASLVSKQRLSEKAKKEQRRRRMGYSSQRSAGSGRLNSRPDPQPFVPAFTRNQVMELLKSYRSGLRLTQLEGAFIKRFGVPFEWRHLGFKSLYKVMDYLHGQSVVVMERYANDYVLSLGAKGYGQQKAWQVAQTSTQPWRSNNVSPCGSQPQHQTIQHDLSNMPSRLRGVTPIIRAVQPDEWREDEGHCVQGKQSPVERVTRPDSNLDDLESDGSMESDNGDISNISQVMKKEVQQLLSAKPDGILASRLIQEYKAVYKKDLGLMELGYYSVLQFVGELQDIIRVERPSASDWLLFDARIPPHSKSPSLEQQHEEEQKELHASSKFDDAFKEELRCVLLRHKEGVLLSELPDVFERLTGKVLDPLELGFKGLDEMLLSIMDKYLNLKYVGKGEMIVSGIEFPSDSLVTSPDMTPVGHSLVKPVSVLVNPAPATCKVPEDVVSSGTAYKSLSLAHLHPAVAEKKYIEVYVSNIINPSRFWLQLRGPDTSEALEELMESLDFYKSKAGERYKMPESMIVVGQVCAVVFPEDENWHRGVIVGIKDLDFVQVYYVDYGNTCTVPKTTLCMLRRKYLRLPCQALQARLTDVAAPETGWTVATMRRMLDLVGNKAIVAEVTDLKDYVLSVHLTDTNTDEDIYVNNLLCEEGYGVYAPDNPEEAQMLAAVQEQAANETALLAGRPRFVKRVELTNEYTVHLVKFNDKPYLVSAEIAAFFWEFDKLRSVLRQKKLDLSREVISYKEYPELFTDLALYNVPWIFEGESLRMCITLYHLPGVSVILKELDHKSDKLKSAVEQLIEAFDPEDPHWNSQLQLESEEADEGGAHLKEPKATAVEQSEEGESLSDSGSVFAELELQEMKITRDVLQIKRKRLLEQLIHAPTSDLDIVDNVIALEMDIKWLNSKINSLTASGESVSSANVLEPPTVPTELSGSNLAAEMSQMMSPSKTKVPPVQVVNPTRPPAGGCRGSSEASLDNSVTAQPVGMASSASSQPAQRQTSDFPRMAGASQPIPGQVGLSVLSGMPDLGIASQPTSGQIPPASGVPVSTTTTTCQPTSGVLPGSAFTPQPTPVVPGLPGSSFTPQPTPVVPGLPGSSFTPQPTPVVPGMPGSTPGAGSQPPMMEDIQYSLLLQSMLFPSMNLLNHTLVRFGVNPSGVTSSTLPYHSAASLAFPAPGSASSPAPPSSQLTHLQHQQQQLASQLQRQQQLAQSHVAFPQLPQQQCQPESLHPGGSSPCKSSAQTQGLPQDSHTSESETSPTCWLQQQYMSAQSQVRQDMLQSMLQQSSTTQQHAQSPATSLQQQQQQQLQLTMSNSVTGNAVSQLRARGSAGSVLLPRTGDVTPGLYPVVDQLPVLEDPAAHGLGQAQGTEAVLLSDLVPLLALGVDDPVPPS